MGEGSDVDVLVAELEAKYAEYGGYTVLAGAWPSRPGRR